MTVEARESKDAHGIAAPDLSAENLAKQVEQTIKLNEHAKLPGWQVETLAILNEYLSDIPGTEEVYVPTACINVLNMTSWKEVTEFVQNDMCSEFFNLALKYCLAEGQNHKKEKGFIDGSGIGYLKKYQARLKETLEQAFDAKYFFKVQRPLEYILQEFKMDLSSIANYIHPGHWSYPAGHGTKFLTAVEVLNDVFHLDRDCYKELLVAACVASMARTGSLIHYPMDNLAGIALVNIER